MEAASVPAAPAAADAGGQVQAPAPEAAPAVQPEAPEPQTDVQAQLKAMEDRIAELQNQNQQPNDFLSQLGTEESDLALTPEEIAALQAGQEPGQVEPDQQAQEQLDAYMKDLVREAVDPIFQERQMEQLESFVKEHPDIQQDEIREPLLETMQALGQRYGQPAEKDTDLLKLAYSSVKAGLADADAVPAGQAADHGASIETQAGQTQTGEASVEEQYVQKLQAAAPGGDVFTR